MSALDPARYEIVSIGIRKDGTWVPGSTDPSELSLDNGLVEVGPSPWRIVIPAGDGTQPLFQISADGDDVRPLSAVDVVFPVLHGPFGEDGTIQGLLEMAGLPYVGCGVFASAAGMDKAHMKTVLQAAGLPVGPYVVASSKRWASEPEAVRAEVAELEFPVYVKPARAGSSLGISKVESLKGLDAAIAAAQEHDPKVVIEQGIAGREVECAVLGGGSGPAKASVPGEVVLAGEKFYDFNRKYVDTAGLTMAIPADIDPGITAQIQQLAVRAFDAFDCEGLTRVDFFVDAEGNPVINEINTMPGFTPFSMYPALWQENGLSYSELVDRLVELALERPTGLR